MKQEPAPLTPPPTNPPTDDKPKKSKGGIIALRIIGWILFVIGGLNIAVNFEVKFMSMKPANDNAMSWIVNIGFIIAGLVMVTRK